MKKIFINITYIVLSVMSITYLFVSCANLDNYETPQGIIVATGHTGLPIIGLLLLFPLIILTIIALTTGNAKVVFSRDVIAFFSSLFIVGSTIIALCISTMNYYYVPVILLLCTLILLVTSSMSIIKLIKEDELTKKDNKEVIEEPKTENE